MSVRRGHRTLGTAQLARLALYAVSLPWIIVCLSNARPGLPLYLGGVLAIALAGAALPRLAPRLLEARSARLLDGLLWNLVLVFLLCEAAVRLFLALGSPAGWLFPDPDPVRYRLDPEQPWVGTRPNSLGFYDAEFTAKRPEVTRVVALGDSYLVGIVPYGENYLTLVDAALGEDVEILNLGVVHMAVRQYLEILQAEGLRLEPDLVLLGIYIGNDIRRDPPRGAFSREALQSLTVLSRIVKVVILGETETQRPMSQQLFRFETDGSRVELPIMSVEQHRAREWKHLNRLFRPPDDRRMQHSWSDTERALDEIIALCRDRGIPVVATLAPDEIQVSRELFEEVTGRYGADPDAFDLDYPGRRLRARLEGLGVPVLDFTQALREAQREAPTYHLRAVHWNRTGNAAVARALAPWLAAGLARLARED